MSSSPQNKNYFGSIRSSMILKKPINNLLRAPQPKKLGFNHRILEKQNNVLKGHLLQPSLSHSLRSQSESNKSSHQESCPTSFFSTFQVTYFTRKIYREFKKYEEECQQKIEDEEISLFKSTNNLESSFPKSTIAIDRKLRFFFLNEVNVASQQSERWMKIISEFINEVQERYQEEILTIFLMMIRQIYILKNGEKLTGFLGKSQLLDGTVSQKIVRNTWISELFFRDKITLVQKHIRTLLDSLIRIFMEVSEISSICSSPEQSQQLADTNIETHEQTFWEKYQQVYPTFQESIVTIPEQDLFCCI